jgi:hypothetical protein
MKSLKSIWFILDLDAIFSAILLLPEAFGPRINIVYGRIAFLVN